MNKFQCEMEYTDLLMDIYNNGFTTFKIGKAYELGKTHALYLQPSTNSKLIKNKEILYLELLIKANKTLYYNGLSIMDDIDYDNLQDQLEKIDPTNKFIDFVGWDQAWLKNDGYRTDNETLLKGK